ncbi:MAG TPA: alpha-E domain-containing protein [Bryobacteraceae bacterium]|nr:alpha-E domain-containing protein [Bryobacteraceae bacterium]
MLSRVADSLYWMSRYLERAEHTARVLGVQLNLMLEQDPKTSDRRWLRTLGSLGYTKPIPKDADPFTLAQTYALQQITAGIGLARENARQVREQISSEMWEHLNRLFHEIKRLEATGLWKSQPLDFLTVILESSHLVQGVTDSTMNHGEGWQFIQVGRFIERAAATARLLDIYFHEFPAGQPMDSGEHMEWIGLLRSCTAFEAYCKVYTADLRPDRIAEFLLLNSEFPHSVRFAADRMQHSLEAINQAAASRRSPRVAKIAGRLSAGLMFTPLEEVVANLAEFFADIQRQCVRIHAAIHEVYITYSIEAAIEA